MNINCEDDGTGNRQIVKRYEVSTHRYILSLLNSAVSP
jgi:hypothetical protein